MTTDIGSAGVTPVQGRRFDQVAPAGSIRGHVDIPEIDRPAPSSADVATGDGMEEGRPAGDGAVDVYA